MGWGSPILLPNSLCSPALKSQHRPQVTCVNFSLSEPACRLALFLLFYRCLSSFSTWFYLSMFPIQEKPPIDKQRNCPKHSPKKRKSESLVRIKTQKKSFLWDWFLLETLIFSLFYPCELLIVISFLPLLVSIWLLMASNDDCSVRETRVTTFRLYISIIIYDNCIKVDSSKFGFT